MAIPWGLTVLWCLCSAVSAFRSSHISRCDRILSRKPAIRNQFRPIPSFAATNGAATVTGTGQAQPTSDILDKFAVDLTALSKMCPPIPSADISANEIFISAGSSYTQLWEHSTWRRHASPPHVRYARHIWQWPVSTTARRILPAVIISMLWAGFVSWAANYFPRFGIAILSKKTGASAAASALSAPLALLLTLRANSSMSRLLEAREAWARMIVHSRNLANLIQIYLVPIAPQAGILAARHLSVLGWILKAKLRDEDDESQLQVLSTMLSGDDLIWLSSQVNRPNAIVARIRQITANGFKRSPTGWASNTPLGFCEDRLLQLEISMAVVERIFSSPIPPTYSRHLSRVLTLWSFFMPINLLTLGFTTSGVMAATAISSYVFMGIDEVGMEIERPSTLLPLQQLSGKLQNAVRGQFVTQVGGGMPAVP